MDDRPIIIVGAGLAGLRCAGVLQQHDVPWLLLETQDGPGGRVRTDYVDGFQLDRGFQVLLTAYPEARAALDYAALDLRAFTPGALVRVPGSFHRVVDPRRRPLSTLSTLRAPVGTLADKARVAWLRRRLLRGSVDDLWRRPERTTREALASLGFSSRMVERFWRPLLAGIQLDPTLHTSSRMFDFVLRMLAEGDNALPSAGIQAIPDQLAAGLPGARIRYNATVVAVDAGGVWLDDGELVRGRAVVVATDGPTASRLLRALPAPGSNRARCLYFAAERTPVDEPVIVLNGEGRGVVNNLCVPSVVAPRYAPQGVSLVSVSVLTGPNDPQALEAAVREQLRGWFGRRVDTWRLLRHYDIAHAQPAQAPPALSPPQRPVEVDTGVFVCGDHRDNASINGALASGHRVADHLAAALALT
ncbi:MAG TPA: NAD(P)/FAD-dependent oxidoreductase [Euzebyales bacterium]|nr:NAD(P)/FAD-dependent oxidoreductase [Euzebyales bacterium]